MVRFHEPVLLKEVRHYLEVREGEKYIDATVGGGGHAKAILKSGGKLLAIDCDPEAVKAAREYFSTACPNTSWRLAQGNFKNLARIAKKNGFTNIAGILFDLGVSSFQLGEKERGFSFDLEGPLDMRMDPELKVTAADLVNGLNKGELNELFSKFGQKYYSRRLAEAIVNARQLKPIRTTRELAAVVSKVRQREIRGSRLHPATLCFLALRVVVNDELNNLEAALPQALSLLKSRGRLLVISFHSGEDRFVKQFLRNSKKEGKIKVITKKPVRPTTEEIASNPRSRSAKLRVGEKWSL